RDVRAHAGAVPPGFGGGEAGSPAGLQGCGALLWPPRPHLAAPRAGAAELFPHRREVAFPLPDGIGAVFMREAAESHRGLFPEHADAYGVNVRAKLERFLRVTTAEFEAGLRRLEEYRERATQALEGVDLLVTPTLAFVAPS